MFWFTSALCDCWSTASIQAFETVNWTGDKENEISWPEFKHVLYVYFKHGPTMMQPMLEKKKQDLRVKRYELHQKVRTMNDPIEALKGAFRQRFDTVTLASWESCLAVSFSQIWSRLTFWAHCRFLMHLFTLTWMAIGKWLQTKWRCEWGCRGCNCWGHLVVRPSWCLSPFALHLHDWYQVRVFPVFWMPRRIATDVDHSPFLADFVAQAATANYSCRFKRSNRSHHEAARIQDWGFPSITKPQSICLPIRSNTRIEISSTRSGP